MAETTNEKNSGVVTQLLEDIFEIGAIYYQTDSLLISLTTRFNRQQSIKMVSDRLNSAGYEFAFHDSDGELFIRINPNPRFRIPIINVVLFLTTLVTVYFIPVFMRHYFAVNSTMGFYGSAGTTTLSIWQGIELTMFEFLMAFNTTLDALAAGAGIEFTLAMISILFVHEMGHFIASRRRNIVTSWPYFIPAPNIIGTFGAIIKSKSPFWNRRDLIEVGAAGPIAGWIVAVAWLAYGLSQSVCVPAETILLPDMAHGLHGESILMKLFTLDLVGAAPVGYAYKLTEAAFAGWVGLLVTAINLLPIGQLDGGHILYGLWRRKQHILGYIAMAALLLLGIQSMIWWFFAIFGIIFGVKHPPTLKKKKKTGGTATGMGILAIFILILSFTPVPF